MKPGALLLLGGALLLGGCDRTAAGREAWSAGRPAEALAAFRRAEQEAGAAASPELAYDVALAALRAGDLDTAEQAASRAASRGGADFEPLSAFVRGSVSFARSLAAEADAAEPGGDPSAMERAAVHAEDALARWRVAAASRPDWPAARRNVERALRRVDALREQRRTGGTTQHTPIVLPGGKPGPKEGDAPDAPPSPPPPEPPAPTNPDAQPKPEGPAVVTGALPPEQVQRLFEVLLERERQKQALRRAVRLAPVPGVERDW